jgi:hypothetical protein
MWIELDWESSTYINRYIVARKLPWVEVEPVVRYLDLISIDNLLLENTIPVSQTITPGGEVEGSQAIEETGGKATKTAIS